MTTMKDKVLKAWKNAPKNIKQAYKEKKEVKRVATERAKSKFKGAVSGNAMSHQVPYEKKKVKKERKAFVKNPLANKNPLNDKNIY